MFFSTYCWKDHFVNKHNHQRPHTLTSKDLYTHPTHAHLQHISHLP